MSKVAIVSDSTGYLPADLVKQYGLTILPQVLIWGDETLEDGVDIQPTEFYTRLQKAKVLPTTSQVTIKSFIEAFSRLLEQGYDILAVLIGNQLSGTLSSAFKAKESFPGANISIVNSNSTSLGMGFPVLLAAEAAQNGASLKECQHLAEEAREHAGVVFAVDTLEFLHRGGRIGGATRFLGTALDIKPLLEIVDGRVEAIERVRTRGKSLIRLVDLVEERIKGQKPVRLGALHANCIEDGKKVLDLASERIEHVQAFISEVSPVVGNHAGPGAVGLAYMAGI